MLQHMGRISCYVYINVIFEDKPIITPSLNNITANNSYVIYVVMQNVIINK